MLKRPDAPLQLAAEEDVRGGGQVVAEREVLIDDLDALGARLDRLVEMLGSPSMQDLALATAGSCRR